MKIRVKQSHLQGKIAVPGSKSHTIRALAAALMAQGKCVVHHPLQSADTLAVLHAIGLMGAKVTRFSDRWEIIGTGGNLQNPNRIIDLGNSGTGLRFLTALAATADFSISFDGDESLRTRLMAGVLDALEKLGARVDSLGGKCPLCVHGPIAGGDTTVDGFTSQFISSLLYGAVFAKDDCNFKVDKLNEKPYVAITLQWLDILGVNYECSSDYSFFKVPAGQHFKPFTRLIPADFSTAAFPLVAGALTTTGDGITLENLDFADIQGDKKVFDFIQQMGCEYRRSDNALTILPSKSRLKGGVFDLNATPDALPVMAVAAALTDGKTILANVPQARFKECDRIEAMATELAKMGIKTSETPDDLVIEGGKLTGAVNLDARDDHRIAMALTVAALNADGQSTIDRAGCIDVTYPDFIENFRSLGAQIDIIEE